MSLVQKRGGHALRWSLRRTVLVALLSCSVSGWAQQSLRKVELRAGVYRIEAEVAVTPQEREIGLMHRRTMAPQAGMLFVFERKSAYCFWMKNTRIPLSVAFLDEDGEIVNIADMQPLSEQSHCAERPVRFALEMNQGWFKAKGIRVGASIKGLGGGTPCRHEKSAGKALFD